jgi:hypothetical protein
MPKVRVYKFDQNGVRLNDGGGKPLPPVDINLPPIDSSLASKVSDVRDGLIKKFDESAQSQTNFAWQDPGTVSTLGQGKDLKPWHTLIGKVSTYPYPVPQSLNLSYIFYVDFGGDGTAQVFAAPLLSAGAPFPSVATSPGDPVAAASKDPKGRVFRASYSAVPEIPVQAYSSLCAVNPPSTPINFIDPKTQWVGDPGSNNHFDDDWLSTFEGRFADALDLSQFLVTFMKDPLQQDLLNKGDNLRFCAALALAALADVRGPGIVPPPDSIALVDKVLDVAGRPPLTTAERQALNNASVYPAQADLRSLLKDVLAKQGTYTTLESSPPRIRISQAITEIEAIRGRIQEQATLLVLAQRQWEKLFANANLPNRVKDVPAMVDAANPETKLPIKQEDRRIRDLRRQMALSNLGRFWSDFIQCNNSGDKSGRAMIEKGVPAFIAYYFAKRFSLTPPAWPGDLRPPTGPLSFSPPVNNVPADLGAKLIEQVQAYAQKVLTSIRPPQSADSNNPPDTGNASRQPNETPHAITLQVDQLATIPTDDPLSDLLKQFSGVGFLMRDKSAGDWMCLNRADLEGSKGTFALDAPALVPYRISYRNNLRQVCASYDNRPLVADSPLSRPDLTSWLYQSKSPFDVLVTPRYSVNAPMPGLTFGHTYQFAVFAIANSGAIPPNLTSRDTGPCVLVPTPKDVTGATIREVEYLRVRIGSASITDIADPRQSMNVPVVPDQVQPRARDLAVFGGDGSPETKTPIILLAPSTWKGGVPSVSGLISRPGTHWDCWHRWVKGSVTDDVRKKVIGDFFRVAQKNAGMSEADFKDPLTVDDPALAPWFYFELQECGDDGKLTAVGKPVWVPISEAGFGDKIITRRAPAVPFTCSYYEPQVGKPSPEPLAVRLPAGRLPAGAAINAAKGRVYRLGIYRTMTAASWARFAPGIVDGVQKPNDVDKNNYYVVSPHFFAIEAVTSDLPAEDAVWGALALREDSRVSGQISADLGDVGPLGKYVQRADLTRQVWRWQGRNTAIHPNFLTVPASELPQRILDWEAVEFGDRPDVDSTVVPMRTKQVSLGGARTFNYSEALKTSKGEFDLRSLHFRFAVTIYSRYEGMTPYGMKNYITGATKLPAANANLDRNGAPVTAQAPAEKVASVWNRVWVPCRRTTDIHAPRLRLILPLTEPGMSKEPNPSPGLLAVFNEPWHESGGLAECLQVRVALTADPAETLSELKHYFFELGPDPVVGHKIPDPLSKSYDPSTQGDTPTVSFSWQGIAGPVGHYFDPTNQAALFTATSFIIPAPQVTGDTVDRRWYFAKLQFRRALMNKVQEIEKPRLENGKLIRGNYKLLDAAAGPYSDPVWTQYLPPFSIFEQTSLVSAGVRMTFASKADGTADTTKMLLINNQQPKRLPAMVSDNANFSLYAVLTRRVFDIAGRPDQEQFLGLYSQAPGSAESDNGWILADTPAIKGHLETGYRVRIIEVQRPKAWDGATPLWKELFGNSTATDVAARIVRISEPIDSIPGSFGTCEGN